MPDSSSSARYSPALDDEAAWEWLIALSATARRMTEASTLPPEAQTPQAAGPDVQQWLDCLTPLAASPQWVVAQLGQSLDGRIATESGHSHYINGPESLVHLHRLRALADAVVVGAGTAAADNPQLTVRHVDGPNPVRVVLDPRGRVPTTLALFQPGDVATLHITGPQVAPLNSAAEQCCLPLNAHGQFQPHDVIALLAERGLHRVLAEGGGITISQFIEAQAVDRLHLLVAPLLIGSGRPGLVMTPIDTLEQALRPTMRSFRCGADTLFDVELRRS
ncbi:hypothetical protein GCM10007158_03100 [Vreelandella hamiltonii]|uniref:Bacterial bifunctional deaminase-reductase C-terminal domain-containing protein n=2 Tax=Halomonadaceae TaxID=28256 RepID=A0ABQ2WAL6_9GAMM|nr:hypothetical protein GCM10007158_03100 [Halomonas johnsoniae]